MKALSASIIVATAAILLLGAYQIAHGQSQTFVTAVACIVGSFGLRGWFIALKETPEITDEK